MQWFILFFSMFTTCTATQRPSCATQQQDVGAVPRLRPLSDLWKTYWRSLSQAEATCSVFAFWLLKEMCERRESGFNLALRRDLLDFGGLLWNIQAKNKTKKCVGGCEKLGAILTNIHSMSCVILDEIWAEAAQQGQWQRPPTSGSDVNHPCSQCFDVFMALQNPWK